MRRPAARSIQPLIVAAIVAPVVALLVLLIDGLLLVFGAEGISRFLSSAFLSWMLLVFPLLLVGGFMIGYRSHALVSLSAMFVVIAAERFHGSLLPSGAINLRFDEVLGPAITAGLLIREWRAGSLDKVRAMLARVPGILPLGLFLVANLIPTLFLMQDRARGLSLYAILIAGSLCYVGTVVLASHVGRIEGVVIPLLITGALEAAFGLGALGLSVALGRPDLFGVQVDAATGAVEPYGTMFEANFFGQYLAAILLIATVFLIDLALREGVRSKHGLALLLMAVLVAAGTLASLARASWLGLLAGAVVIAFVWPLRGALWRSGWIRRVGSPGGRAGFQRQPSLLAVLAVAVTGTIIMLLAATNSTIGQRLSSVLDFSTGSGYGRLRVLKLVLSDWHNPILGMGDGSFNLTLPPLPGKSPDAPWIYSMFLAILHDSGVVGMALFLWFLWEVFAVLIKTVRRSHHPAVQALALGLVGALTILLIAGQATTAMYLMFFWVFVGLAAAAPLIAAGVRPIDDQETVALPIARSAIVPIDALETIPVPAPLPQRGRAAAVVIDHSRQSTATSSGAVLGSSRVGTEARGHPDDNADYAEGQSLARTRVGAIADYILPALVGGAALALNFYRLNGFDIWYDEATSYGYASQSLPVMIHAFFASGSKIALPNMTLYYFVLHWWIGLLKLFGVTPTADVLRAPSAYCAALSVVVVYFLGRRFFSRLVGAVGAVLYLCSYLELYAGQQVRAYGLLMLLLCMAWYTLFAALHAQDARQRNLWWIGYTGLMILAITDHLWGIFVLAGQMVTIGAMLWLPGPLRDQARRSLRQLVLSFGLLAAFIVPIYLYALNHGGESTWIPTAHPSDLVGFFAFEAGGGRFQPIGMAILILLPVWANGAAWLGYLPQLTARAEAARAAMQHAAGRLLARPRPGVLALCCWLFVPTILTFAVTQPYLNLHVFYVRYLMAVSPAFYLLVAAGMAALRWRIGQYALAALVVVAALIHAPDYYASQAGYLDYHTPTLWLEQHYRPGDGLACDQSDTCAIPMQYYFQLYNGPAHFDSDSPGNWTWDLSGGIPNDGATLTTYAAKHPHVCLLLSADTSDSRTVQQWFDAHGHLEAQTIGAIRIRCYAMHG